MIALEEAQAKVNRDLSVPAPADMPVSESLGMVLAETVAADEAIPPFANTAMDGFAVRAEDTIGASKAGSGIDSGASDDPPILC
ncbi:MAG: hypothetical protein WBM50_23820, partial [Acidimicrobiales bacterium]